MHGGRCGQSATQLNQQSGLWLRLQLQQLRRPILRFTVPAARVTHHTYPPPVAVAVASYCTFHYITAVWFVFGFVFVFVTRRNKLQYHQDTTQHLWTSGPHNRWLFHAVVTTEWPIQYCTLVYIISFATGWDTVRRMRSMSMVLVCVCQVMSSHAASSMTSETYTLPVVCRWRVVVHSVAASIIWWHY
jgi:hypothetical protein